MHGPFAVELEGWTRAAYVFGPLPVSEGIERLKALHARGILAEAKASTSLARLLTMAGDLEVARELQNTSRETVRQAGLATTAVAMASHAAWIEQRAGDLTAWEYAARSGIEELERLEERPYHATALADLALCVYLQGRYDEAATLCATVRDLSPADDLVNFIYADALEGAVRAQHGAFEEAERQCRRAVELADETDSSSIARRRGCSSRNPFSAPAALRRPCASRARRCRSSMPRAT
jgi:tetratricopeptide (TPR) repeat protein